MQDSDSPRYRKKAFPFNHSSSRGRLRIDNCVRTARISVSLNFHGQGQVSAISPEGNRTGRREGRPPGNKGMCRVCEPSGGGPRLAYPSATRRQWGACVSISNRIIRRIQSMRESIVLLLLWLAQCPFPFRRNIRSRFRSLSLRYLYISKYMYILPRHYSIIESRKNRCPNAETTNYPTGQSFIPHFANH